METSSTDARTIPADETSVAPRLNEEQGRTLEALLNLMIPPSEDGRMPGAADVSFLAYMHAEDITPWVQGGLLAIVEESRNHYGREFSALSGPEQTALVEALRRRHFRFFSELSTHVIQCYYQDDRVLEAIGLEARPPFALGYVVQEGDLTLLEPVIERGKLYRG